MLEFLRFSLVSFSATGTQFLNGFFKRTGCTQDTQLWFCVFVSWTNSAPSDPPVDCSCWQNWQMDSTMTRYSTPNTSSNYYVFESSCVLVSCSPLQTWNGILSLSLIFDWQSSCFLGKLFTSSPQPCQSAVKNAKKLYFSLSTTSVLSQHLIENIHFTICTVIKLNHISGKLVSFLKVHRWCMFLRGKWLFYSCCDHETP